MLGNDYDFDGDVLSIVSVDGSSTIGLVTLTSSGEVVYSTNGQFDFLNLGETATDTFSYTVSDGNGGFDTAQVTITITGVADNGNTDPIANDDNFSTDEDTVLDIDVLANDQDADGDSLVITEVNGDKIDDPRALSRVIADIDFP